MTGLKVQDETHEHNQNEKEPEEQNLTEPSQFNGNVIRPGINVESVAETIQSEAVINAVSGFKSSRTVDGAPRMLD